MRPILIYIFYSQNQKFRKFQRYDRVFVLVSQEQAAKIGTAYVIQIGMEKKEKKDRGKKEKERERRAVQTFNYYDVIRNANKRLKFQILQEMVLY